MKEDQSKKQEGNVYDRIFKENAISIFIPLIEQELDFEIAVSKRLPEKISKTFEREVDFLYEITSTDNQSYLLHLEFQTKSDNNMIYRMAEYHGLLLRNYKRPIFHFVIYLGTNKSKMKTQLTQNQIFNSFHLINLNELDASTFLKSDIPEVVLLALLGNFDAKDGKEIVEQQIEQLRAISSSEIKLRKYMEQLLILSRLRKLETVTSKVLDNMPVIYDHTKDDLFLKGVEQGIEQGKEEGREEGKEENFHHFVRLLYKNGSSISEIAKKLEIDSSEVERILYLKKY